MNELSYHERAARRRRRDLILDAVSIGLPVLFMLGLAAYYAEPAIHNTVAWLVTFAP